MLSKKVRIVLISGFFIASLLLIHPWAQAGLSTSIPSKPPENVPGAFSSIKYVIASSYNFVITISGVVFMIMMLVGGVLYLTGASNEEQTGKAKKMMIEALVGLIITLSAWAIGTFVINQFKGGGDLENELKRSGDLQVFDNSTGTIPT